MGKLIFNITKLDFKNFRFPTKTNHSHGYFNSVGNIYLYIPYTISANQVNGLNIKYYKSYKVFMTIS